MGCGGSQRTVCPEERMDRAEPEWDVEGARGPCALKKEWTEQSLNGMWREPEDRVPWRKNGHG